MSIKEYLEKEEKSVAKHEYANGIIWAMSGGTINHSLLAININFALNSVLRQTKKPCLVFNSDLKVFIEKAASFVYPDAMVICGDVEVRQGDKNAVTNPLLIRSPVEIDWKL